MFQVTTTVTAQQVADLIVGAIEGGSTYWCSEYNILKTPAEVVPNGVVVYSHPEFWAGDFEIEFKDGEDDDKSHTITPEVLKKGIQVMAEKAPRHFRDWMQENDDAETSDVFLQCILFGEIVYG